jgi:glycosyltransferase involved in cell wall biosynthesis
MMKRKILAVHLLNDFSGSPFVFRQAIEALVDSGEEVVVFTATPTGNGFLSNIKDVKYVDLFYKWNKNKWLTLMFFFFAQMSIFFKIAFSAKRNDVVYINSILPFGAALAAKLRGARVLYHVHEVSVKPASLKNFLLGVVQRTADRCIYVSQYVMSATKVTAPDHVVYNALPNQFVERANNFIGQPKNDFTILLLCSLKKYKGVLEFVEAAKQLPNCKFELVANSDTKSINDFFSGMDLPSNLIIHSAASDVHPFYQRADVVVNLSRPDEWIETFGMTALEAMVYGKPVIVPPVGGITELINDGVEGFRVDSRNVNDVVEKIKLLSTDPALYAEMSIKAKLRSNAFTQEMFRTYLKRVVEVMDAGTVSSNAVLSDIQ